MKTELEQYLSEMGQALPVMPMIAKQVMKVVDSPIATPDDLREIVAKDAAIAAQILKVSNSALFGFSGRIQSLGHAIALLGSNQIRNLVLAASLKQTYKRFGLLEKNLWEHSSMAGPVAWKLAERPGMEVDPEEAFTAGLLHDIGRAALLNTHRDVCDRVMARVEAEGVSSIEAEREELGFDHAELGARVAEKWELPARLVAAIEHHHSAGALADLPEEDAQLTALTAVTSSCLHYFGVGRRHRMEELERCDAWGFLGLGDDDVEPILALCADQLKISEAMIR